MFSLNTTIDSQQSMNQGEDMSPQKIRHKISQFVIEINKELKIHSRKQLLMTLSMHMLAITDDELIKAEQNDQLTRKSSEQGEKGQNLELSMQRLEQMKDSEELVITMVDNIDLSLGVIRTAMKETSLILENIRKMRREGKLDAENENIPLIQNQSRDIKVEKEAKIKKFNKVRCSKMKQKQEIQQL